MIARRALALGLLALGSACGGPTVPVIDVPPAGSSELVQAAPTPKAKAVRPASTLPAASASHHAGVLLQAAVEFQTRACACKDIPCTTEATRRFGERVKGAGGGAAGEEDDIGKATTAATECITKMTMAGVQLRSSMPVP
jgi:hypothetical protein